MADMVIDTTFNLNATQALAAVAEIGRRADAMLAKLGNTGIKIDTKPAETDLKELQTTAEKTFKAIGDDAEKSVSKAGGGGLFAGLKESFAQGQDAAGSGGGIFGSLAGTIGQLASPVGAVTAGIGLLTAGLAESFQVGAEFQKNMAAVSAITGITGAGLDDIGTRAQDLAAKFGGTATTQLESFQGVLSRFGAQLADTPDDLGKVSESINLLAKAGGIDAASAMDTLTTAMLQFGVDTSNSSELASESARFINVMAASARVGAAEIPQVGEAVKVAGVAMKGAKVSFEEGNAAIQVLAAGGKVGAEAGTALRNVLGKIAGEEVIPKEALAKLKSLGVDMKLVSNTALPLETRLKELSKASGDATAFAQVFGSENAAAASILANGADTVGKWTAEITGTQDASKQAAVNMGTFTEQIGRAKASFENTLINVNKVLSPILAQVFGTLTQVFSSVYNAIAPVFTRLGATLGATFERIAQVAKPVLAFIGGYILTNLVVTISAAGTILDALLQTAIKVFDGIIAAVQPIVTAFKKAFDITDDVTKSFDPLETFQKILTTITDVISFFGSILVEVGGFIAQWLIAPIRLGATVVGLLIEPLVNIGKSLFGFGETTKTAGGFFESFIDIVKQAPGFIRAVTAGFSAFVGGITDLITNFSFDKLKNLLTGKTVSDAFIGSVNESKVKAESDKLLGSFGASADRLTKLAEKANLTKSEQDKRNNLAAQELQKKFNAVDFEREKELLLAKTAQQKKAINEKYDKQKEAITKSYELQKKQIETDLKSEKEKDKVAFQVEKVRIAEAINAKEKAGEITKEKAQELRAKILDINLVADKNDADAAAKAAKAGEKGKQDSLKEEIAKAAEENRKLRGESDAAQIKDELARAIKANEEKFLAAQRAVQKEIEETKKKKDVSEKERQALLELLYEKENLVLENGLNARDEIIAKHNQKQRDEEEKKAKDYAKSIEDRNKEVEKINAELDKKEAEEHRKSIEQRITAEQKYAETHRGIFQRLADNTNDIFKGISDGFTAAFTVDNSVGEAAKKEADAQLAELKKSLQARLISFSDYQDKVAEISAKAADAGGDAGKSFGDKFVDGLNKSLQSVSKVFDNIGKSTLKQYEADNKEVADINKELEKELILQKELGASDTIDQARERDKTIAKLREKSQKAEIGSLSDMEVAYTAFGVVVGGSLLQAVADGTNLWQAFVLSAFDALSALVPVFTAMILGKELAEKGIFGLATAPILTGLLLIAVNVAKAAVTSGFYKGGYTGGGADNTVKGHVHEKEYVFSKVAVKEEVSAFDKLHGILKGGESITNVLNAYENRELSNTFVSANGLIGNVWNTNNTDSINNLFNNLSNINRSDLSTMFVNTNGAVNRYEVAPRDIHTVRAMDNRDAVISELRAQTAVLSNKLDAVLGATEAMPTAFRGNVKHEFKFHHDPSINIKKAAHEERRKALQ